ncbi:Protein Associated with Differentiation [Novymonas esmeraldas]|uniref:Protein Associated with Differentiation n=1 Tax=Novymonas esmeraldas TaxID=1808958 RepID=A0AAW0EJ79_9TRYP
MVNLHLNGGEEVHLEALAAGPQKPLSELRRFAILLLGSLAMICASFGYAFNLISGAMQARYDLTLRDMTTITTCGLVFGFFMLPYGFLYDYAGPIPISVIAIVTVVVGTVCMALCFQGTIEGSVVKLAVFNAILNIGVSLFDLVACMTVISYFPTNRGAVIALLKVFAGLGSAIVGSLKSGFFTTHVDYYYYFLLSFASVMGLLLIAFMRLPEYHLTGYEMSHLDAAEIQERLATKTQYLKQKPPMRRFAYAFVVLVLLIIYLPTESAIVSYKGLGHRYQLAFAVVTIVLTLALTGMVAPLSVLDHSSLPFAKYFGGDTASSKDAPFSSSSHSDLAELEDAARPNGGTTTATTEPITRDSATKPTVQDSSVVSAHVDGEVSSTPIDAAAATHVSHRGGPVETEVDYIAPQYQGTFLQNLLSLNLWALWWSIFCVIGAEFVIIYNARNILGALQGHDPTDSLNTLLTVLNGVGSAVGRLLMSYLEVWSQKRKAEDRLPITFALFLPTGSVIISLVLFLTLPAVALPLPYVIAALGNGFLAATIVLVSRTIFAKDAAKHYNFCFTATMTGSIFHNRLIFGEWYASQADKQKHANHLCYGKSCVLGSMILMLGLACTGFLTSSFLHLRYSLYCKRVLAERAAMHGAADQATTGWEVAVDLNRDDLDCAK